jgi:tRNA (guanine9-N1)-methyltransferase
MSEIEERPSKIRKVESPEHCQDSAHQLPNLNLGAKNGADHSNEKKTPKNEENDLSKIDIQEPMKEDPPLSKNQLKKRRRDEAWQAAKELRKEKRRDKRHEKQARKAEERAELQEKMARGEIEAPLPSPEELARKTKRPVLLPVTLIVDCDFDELMTEKELISLGAQLTRCYSDNRHSKYRAHMVMSSWEGSLRTRFETVLTNHHKGWRGVRFLEKDFIGSAKEMDGIMRSRNGGQLVGAFAPGEGAKTVPQTKEDGPEKVNGPEPLAVEETVAPVSEEVIMGEPKELDHIEDSPQKDGLVPEELKEETPAGQPSTAPEPPTGQTATSTSPDSKSQPADSIQEAGSGAIIASTTTEPPPPSEPSLVYLTSDSPHTLDRLSPNTSYIIGGIVDKNRHKGLCYKRACERGIPTAKLPIGEYMTMQSRSVLAVNHVVEIMLKWLETGDWGEAFLSVIPKRKEAKLRVKKESGQKNGRDEESEDGEDDSGDKIEEDDVKMEETTALSDA